MTSQKRLEGACITREQFLLREMRVVARLRVEELSDEEAVARVAKAVGARKVLLPLGCIQGLQQVPVELMGSVSPDFYPDGDVVAAAKKALGL